MSKVPTPPIHRYVFPTPAVPPPRATPAELSAAREALNRNPFMQGVYRYAPLNVCSRAAATAGDESYFLNMYLLGLPPPTIDVLACAAGGGFASLVRALISYGTPVVDPFEHNDVGLHGAAMGGHVDVALELIAAGASLCYMTCQGTPLYLALQGGNPDFFEVMLQAFDRARTPDSSADDLFGPHKDAITSQFVSKYHTSPASGRTLRRLCEVAVLSSTTPFDPIIVLEKAIRADSLECVHVMLDFVIDLGHRGHFRQNVFMTAVEQVPGPEILAALLASELPVSDRESRYSEALIQACRVGSMEKARMLLARGANLNYVGQHGNAPLHAAILNKHPDITEFLVSAGADVNVLASDHTTPLHYAGSADASTRTVDLLLKRGANAALTSATGALAVMSYVRANNVRAVRMFLAAGVLTCRNARSLAWAFHTVLDRDDTAMAVMLIRHGVDFGVLLNTPVRGRSDLMWEFTRDPAVREAIGVAAAAAPAWVFARILARRARRLAGGDASDRQFADAIGTLAVLPVDVLDVVAGQLHLQFRAYRSEVCAETFVY